MGTHAITKTRGEIRYSITTTDGATGCTNKCENCPMPHIKMNLKEIGSRLCAGTKYVPSAKLIVCVQ